MISKTISITIPDKLESDLQKQADEIGISRSRFICNLLLEWQKNQHIPINDCGNQNDGWCTEFGSSCQAVQKEANTCSDYFKGNN